MWIAGTVSTCVALSWHYSYQIWHCKGCRNDIEGWYYQPISDRMNELAVGWLLPRTLKHLAEANKCLNLKGRSILLLFIISLSAENEIGCVLFTCSDWHTHTQWHNKVIKQLTHINFGSFTHSKAPCTKRLLQHWVSLRICSLHSWNNHTPASIQVCTLQRFQLPIQLCHSTCSREQHSQRY